MVAVYPIGFPLFCFFTLFRYRRQINPTVEASAEQQELIRGTGFLRLTSTRQMEMGIEERRKNQELQRFRFLFEEYEPRCWWFAGGAGGRRFGGPLRGRTFGRRGWGPILVTRRCVATTGARSSRRRRRDRSTLFAPASLRPAHERNATRYAVAELTMRLYLTGLLSFFGSSDAPATTTQTSLGLLGAMIYYVVLSAYFGRADLLKTGRGDVDIPWRRSRGDAAAAHVDIPWT